MIVFSFFFNLKFFTWFAKFAINNIRKFVCIHHYHERSRRFSSNMCKLSSEARSDKLLLLFRSVLYTLRKYIFVHLMHVNEHSSPRKILCWTSFYAMWKKLKYAIKCKYCYNILVHNKKEIVNIITYFV